MEWVGLSLALLGLAIGIIPLVFDEHTPIQLHKPLEYIATMLLIGGFVAGLKPLRKPIVLGLRFRFGRYPLLFIYLFAEMFTDPKNDRKIDRQFRLALQDEYVSGELWGDLDIGKKVVAKLLNAARDGKVHFYGRLAVEAGTLKWFTKIPEDHLRTHEIETMVGMQQLSNAFVYTYDPKFFDKTKYLSASLMNGCYCDLHISRNIKTLMPELFTRTQ